MTPAAYAPIFACSVLFGMLLMLELGRRIGRWRLAAGIESWGTGTGIIDGAAFTLVGLLVTFTFSTAATRFDARRQLTIQEANHISTAWLRIDLLPADVQPGMRDLFREYLDSRLQTYRSLPDLTAAQAQIVRSTGLQRRIWADSVAACERLNTPAVTTLVLGKLNEMFDITTTRTMSAQIHPPPIIYVLLAAAALFSALLAGIAMAGSQQRSWMHFVGFAVMLSVTLYVILDLEYPRYGLIRVDAFDQVLVSLRESMN